MPFTPGFELLHSDRVDRLRVLWDDHNAQIPPRRQERFAFNFVEEEATSGY